MCLIAYIVYVVPLGITYAVANGSDAHKKYVYDLIKEDGVKYIIATCTKLTNDSVTLSTGETISFDVAVVATGVSLPTFYPDPESETTAEQRKEAINKVSEEIKTAASVLVSGGGPVGVEAAADIKLKYPAKRYVSIIFQRKQSLTSHNVITFI